MLFVFELFLNLNKVFWTASFIEKLINTLFDFLEYGWDGFEDLLFVGCKTDLNLFFKFDFFLNVGN